MKGNHEGTSSSYVMALWNDPEHPLRSAATISEATDVPCEKSSKSDLIRQQSPKQERQQMGWSLFAAHRKWHLSSAGQGATES